MTARAKNVGFETAFAALKQGKAARREKWRPGVSVILIPGEALRKRGPDASYRWTPATDELLAEDWQILEAA